MSTYSVFTTIKTDAGLSIEIYSNCIVINTKKEIITIADDVFEALKSEINGQEIY
jgi:hypothetical protein